MYMYRRLVLVLCLTVICHTASLLALAPQLISAQGKITQLGGANLPDGIYSVTFAIYDSPAGGVPVWTETNPAVAVSNGKFNVLLGSINPISSSVFSGINRFLGVTVGSDPEMTPRSQLVSVGYSQRVATIDGATGGAVSGNLEIGGEVFVGGQRALSANAQDIWLGDLLGGDGMRGLVLKAGDADRVKITTTGKVGIGTNDPNATLDVWGSIGFYGNSYIIRDGSLPSGGGLVFGTDGTDPDQHRRLVILDNGYVGIGTTDPSQMLHVMGTTKTEILEITGGSDLAEPFETIGTAELAVGSVVVIDVENPGMLKLSHCAYDTRVAGIVSGAGGVRPGLTLRQEGSLDQGQNIALSGRVYVLATASNGPIRAGDLLTTSDLAGHAMKATDRDRWSGAVIGKAMTELSSGEGLVLVLVSLQ